MEMQLPDKAVGATDFRIWLQIQFTERCKRNSKYSLRAFSMLLNSDASSISQIFSGKRQASTKVISKICQILGASPHLQKNFIKKSKAKFKKSNTVTEVKELTYELLAADAFSVVSDWYHFAILELINVHDFNQSPSWCARTLGISTVEAQMAIERLVRLGLLRFETQKLVRTNKLITNFHPGMTSSAHKNLQRQILQMAIDAIDTVSAEEKDITAMTMAIDVRKIPEAKKLIAKFRRDLSSYLEDGKQTQVYQLAVQLYPISKNKHEEKKK